MKTSPVREADTNLSRLRYLDSLRGLAALAVVFWHWQHFFIQDGRHIATFSTQEQPLYAYFSLLYTHGWLAVDLFFLLSGLIFFWLYAQRIANRRVSFQTFLIWRFSRLYPLHLVTLSVVLLGQLLYGLGAKEQTGFVYLHNDLKHFLLHILMLTSVGLEQGFSFNGPIWSVSVEMMLYVFFFAIARWVLPLARTDLQQLACMVLFVGSGLLLESAYSPLGRGLMSFFLGGILCIIFIHISRNDWLLRRSQPVLLTVATLAWGCLFVFEIPGVLALPSWAIDTSLRLILFPLTVLALALTDVRLPSCPNPLAKLGDLSYSVYLWHFPLQLFAVLATDGLGIGRPVFHEPLVMGLFFVILLLISTISYHKFELPAQQVVRAWWAGRI